MVALSSLEQLYRQVILDHATHPRNKRLLTNCSHQIELLNPTCGDAVQVQMQVVDEVIVDIAFNGHGCSIAMASASMMTEILKGYRLSEAVHIIEAFNQLVGGQPSNSVTLSQAELEEVLADAYLLEGVKQFPARYKCAILAWKASQACIQEVQLEEGLAIGQSSVTNQESELKKA